MGDDAAASPPVAANTQWWGPRDILFGPRDPDKPRRSLREFLFKAERVTEADSKIDPNSEYARRARVWWEHPYNPVAWYMNLIADTLTSSRPAGGPADPTVLPSTQPDTLVDPATGKDIREAATGRNVVREYDPEKYIVHEERKSYREMLANVCPETRDRRDWCLNAFGNCETQIERHFQCLEALADGPNPPFTKERVQILRNNFKSSAYDYPTDERLNRVWA